MRHFFTSLFALLCTAATTLSAQQDRGFIHPGGLHTQADFDRVKAQLAAGNDKVTQAYQRLKTAAYAQPSVQTYPVETIVRGGGVGENYINAARGATMAYQNALRWKIEGNTACANAAVRILMAWANTTKHIGGDSNYALAAGLYGYQFAQAAELMRDYEGWAADDLATFRRWMLDVWYPASIGFLRGRLGTWENTDKWWQAPGHYWSNWGLCNALCVVSIGVLCDDVFIYNQGMSYFKYDQVGNFTDPPTLHDVTGHGDDDGTQCIWNDGLTEFLGNLVVTDVETPLETGAYGHLGQMNESGRDTGHSAMALGLAIDLAKVGWNQGDDLFAYMNHRLAAGIEYVAAQTQSVDGLPWTPYLYGNNGYYYSDYRTWLMGGPALGAQIRPYWGTVIGIYEGVKGVQMPFAKTSYNSMGIDEGGMGSTSGGYDHLGYSVLMNTRDTQLCPASQVPTELRPKMEYSGTLSSYLIPSIAKERARGNINGSTILHNELGGLVNTYTVNTNTGVPTGQTITLTPLLPDDESDSGQWLWDTGETTRQITVNTDHSRIYRVTYTNSRGIKSQLSFAIAVKGDCLPDRLTPTVAYNGTTFTPDTETTASDNESTAPDNESTAATATANVSILYGKTAVLGVNPSCGWGTFKWSTNATTQTITTPSITADRDISVTFTNQGGATSTMTFHITMLPASPYYTVGQKTQEGTDIIVGEGESVTLGLTTPALITDSRVNWSTGDTGKTLTLSDLHTSGTYEASFTLNNTQYTFTFNVLVKAATAPLLQTGNYLIEHVATGRLLTGHGSAQAVTFEQGDITAPSEGQTWHIDNNGTAHVIVSLPDSLGLGTTTRLSAARYYSFYLDTALSTDLYALHTGLSAGTMKYWNVDDSGAVVTASQFGGFPFRMIPLATEGIGRLSDNADGHNEKRRYYTPDGMQYRQPQRGLNIVRIATPDGRVKTIKISR